MDTVDEFFNIWYSCNSMLAALHLSDFSYSPKQSWPPFPFSLIWYYWWPSPITGILSLYNKKPIENKTRMCIYYLVNSSYILFEIERIYLICLPLVSNFMSRMKIIYLKTKPYLLCGVLAEKYTRGLVRQVILCHHTYTTGDRLTAASTQGGDLGFERERQTAQGKGQEIVHLHVSLTTSSSCESNVNSSERWTSVLPSPRGGCGLVAVHVLWYRKFLAHSLRPHIPEPVDADEEESSGGEWVGSSPGPVTVGELDRRKRRIYCRLRANGPLYVTLCCICNHCGGDRQLWARCPYRGPRYKI
jgi:hypothetical protein